jgi:hypothetical protein
MEVHRLFGSLFSCSCFPFALNLSHRERVAPSRLLVPRKATERTLRPISQIQWLLFHSANDAKLSHALNGKAKIAHAKTVTAMTHHLPVHNEPSNRPETKAIEITLTTDVNSSIRSPGKCSSRRDFHWWHKIRKMPLSKNRTPTHFQPLGSMKGVHHVFRLIVEYSRRHRAR